MAEIDNEQNRTYLDDVLEFGTPSAALIFGLTRPQQDKVIKDFARRTIDRYLDRERDRFYRGDLPQFDYNFISRSSGEYRDKLVDAIHRLPEEVQDSWLLSTWDSGDPRFLQDASKSSYFDPSVNSVHISRYDPYTIIHEYAHAANQRMNNQRPENRMLNAVPDRMAEINLGKKIDEEIIRDLREKSKTAISRNNRSEIESEIKKKIGYVGNVDTEKNIKNAISDMIVLDPYVDINDGVLNGHQKAYKKAQVRSNKFILPKSNKTAPYYAPMSIEGGADFAEVMASPYGNSWMEKHIPGVNETIIDEYRNDPYKAKLKNGTSSLPYMWTVDDGELYDPNEKRQYYRVRSPYGGYNYEAGQFNAEHEADKLNKGYYEYRDHKDEWNRVNTDAFVNDSDYGKPKTFNGYYKYYIDTPNGRKGFRMEGPMLDYVIANPDLRNVYENKLQYNDDHSIKRTGEGNPLRQWEPYDSERLNELVGHWKPVSNKDRIEKFRKERKFMEKVAREKNMAERLLKRIR